MDYFYKSHNGAYKGANRIAREDRVPAYVYSIPRPYDGTTKTRQFVVKTEPVRPPGGNKLWAILPLTHGVTITWAWADDVDRETDNATHVLVLPGPGGYWAISALNGVAHKALGSSPREAIDNLAKADAPPNYFIDWEGVYEVDERGVRCD